MPTLMLSTGLCFAFDLARDYPPLSRMVEDWGMRLSLRPNVQVPGWSTTFVSRAGSVILRRDDLDALFNSRFDLIPHSAHLRYDNGAVAVFWMRSPSEGFEEEFDSIAEPSALASWPD